MNNTIQNTYTFKLKKILFLASEETKISNIKPNSYLCDDLHINQYDIPYVKAEIKNNFGIDISITEQDLNLLKVEDLLKDIRIKVREKSVEQKRQESWKKEIIKTLSVRLSNIRNHKRNKTL